MSFFSDFKDVAGIVGGVAEAGGNVLGAGAQEDAAGSANALASRIYFDQRRDLKPFRKGGTAAFNSLIDTYLTGERDYKASPGYQFRVDEGTKALERGAAARGGQFSGRQAKALTRFGQNTATADYDQNFNRLAALAGVGQTAVNAGNNAAAQYGANAGNAILRAGDARASGFTGAGSAVTGGINNRLFLDAFGG